jgi:hypothetical protein
MTQMQVARFCCGAPSVSVYPMSETIITDLLFPPEESFGPSLSEAGLLCNRVLGEPRFIP